MERNDVVVVCVMSTRTHAERNTRSNELRPAPSGAAGENLLREGGRRETDSNQSGPRSAVREREREAELTTQSKRNGVER